MRQSDDWLTNLRGETFLIRTEEIEVAKWISEFGSPEFIIRSDDISAGTVLAPYAELKFGEYEEVATVQYIGVLHGYLYLRHISVAEELFIQRNLDKSFLEWQVADERDVNAFLSRANLLVTNGVSCVYFWDSQPDIA